MKQRLSTPQWDAELNTDVCDAYNNADLTLQLRLGFRQINPPGNAASGTYHNYGEIPPKPPAGSFIGRPAPGRDGPKTWSHRRRTIGMAGSGW